MAQDIFYASEGWPLLMSRLLMHCLPYLMTEKGLEEGKECKIVHIYLHLHICNIC